jgi:putative transposase
VRQQVFQFIRDWHHQFGVERMCRVLKVTKSGYYHWIDRKPSRRDIERQEITFQIKKVYNESKSRYGSPKIAIELQESGWKVSRPRVARIMRKEGIRSIICKKFRGITTDSKHSYPIAENHLKRNFLSSSPGHKWVSDITYIPTRQGWMYLTVIMDLYDRKIIGWSWSTSMTTQTTVMAAWRMALIHRPINQTLIFHSDRGVQYASHVFTEMLKKYKVKQSMSRKGNCWDNAVAENFFKILKSELVKHAEFTSVLHAKSELFEFIEIWYNRKRKHSALGYKTPEQFGKINYSKCA